MQKHLKVKALCAVVVGTLALLLVFNVVGLRLMSNTPTPRKALKLYCAIPLQLPFRPRSLKTVGDEILTQHLFGFHGHTSFGKGFLNNLSVVEIDRNKNRLTVSPNGPLLKSDGTKIEIDQVCGALDNSFRAATHSIFRKVTKNVSCTETSVIIELEKIPVNIKEFFAAPDMAITDEQSELVEASTNKPTSGPYFLKSIEGNTAILGRNTYYPDSLVANLIDEVEFTFGDSKPQEEVLGALGPGGYDLLYVSGHGMSKKLLEEISQKGYRTHIFPSEYVSYIGFNQSRMNLEKRKLIGSIIDLSRQELVDSAPLAQPAYSMCPSDRPYCINETEYDQLISKAGGTDSKLSDSVFTIGILGTARNRALTQAVLNILGKKLPNLQVKIVADSDYTQLQETTDFHMFSLGITPADPLPQYAYMLGHLDLIKGVVNKEELGEISLLDDYSEYSKRVKAIETKIAEERRLVPLVTFPGVVIEGPGMERDEDLAWAWGVQAWTYRVTTDN